MARVLLVVLSLATAGAAQDRRRDLEEIGARIADLERAAEEAGSRARDLLGEFAATRARLALQRARVSEAEEALRLAQERLEGANADVRQLEETVERRRQQLRAHLLSIERFGRRGYLRLILDVDRQADLLGSVRLLRYLVGRDGRTLSRYREARTRLELRREALDRERAEVQQLAEEERARRAELEQLRRRQQRQLAALEERRARLVARARELATKKERLGRLIELIEEEGPAAFEGVPMDEVAGALDWPVAGTVATEFGLQREGVYGTRLPHNGIEIETARGSRVRTIYPGRVLFAAPFQDFGFTVVVQHPGKILSLYAGLEELGVGEGDVLTFGAPVGRSSDRLYLEIRRGKTPEDPRAWLR